MNITGILSGQPVSWYAILTAAGSVAALLYIFIRAPRYALDREDSLYIYVWGMIGMAVGAKLLYLCVSLPEIVRNAPLFTEDAWAFVRAYLTGGFVYYGGLGGVIAGTCLAARYFHKKWEDYIPLFVPALCLFHMCGRIGCYTAGCCGGIHGFPTQLVEAGVAACFFFYLAAAEPKHPLRFYLTGYALLRFFLEFLRADLQRGFIGPLSVSQWISLGLLLGILLSQKRKFCAS